MTESPRRTPERWNESGDKETAPIPETQGGFERVLREENVGVGKVDIKVAKDGRVLVKKLKEK